MACKYIRTCILQVEKEEVLLATRNYYVVVTERMPKIMRIFFSIVNLANSCALKCLDVLYLQDWW